MPLQRRLIEIVFLWCLVGYPIVGIFSTIADFNNNIISIAFRIIIIMISLFLVSTAVSSGKFRFSRILTGFIILYFCRLVFDYLYQGNDYALIAIQIYLATVVIPVVAIGSY